MLFIDPDPASRALLPSQRGPGASCALTVFPTGPDARCQAKISGSACAQVGILAQSRCSGRRKRRNSTWMSPRLAAGGSRSSLTAFLRGCTKPRRANSAPTRAPQSLGLRTRGGRARRQPSVDVAYSLAHARGTEPRGRGRPLPRPHASGQPSRSWPPCEHGRELPVRPCNASDGLEPPLRELPAAPP